MNDTYRALQILSETFGIEPEFMDNWGRIFRTDPETARSILMARGVTIDPGLMELNPQVIVVSDDSLPESWSILFPQLRQKEAKSEPLSGTVKFKEVDAGTEESVWALGHEGVTYGDDETTGLLRVAVPFPRHLPPGQYRFVVEVTRENEFRSAEVLLFICPSRAYLPPVLEDGGRIAGVGVALYGVRSSENWGVGDFADLRKITDWAAEDLGVDFVGLNPLHALFNRRPFNHSPYLPSSRMFRNFIYLDVPGIPDFRTSPEAKSLTNSLEFVNTVEGLRNEEHVNYEEVSGLKLKVLKLLYQNFAENRSGCEEKSRRREDFERYSASEGRPLQLFATFCALNEHFEEQLPGAATWRHWPSPYHDPNSDEVAQFQQNHEEKIRFWKYLQWQIDLQLKEAQRYALEKGMAVGLYHDEALAVDRNGADAWAMSEYFHEGFRVGAPPDAFAPEGQDWGFPPPNRDTIRKAGYAPFLKKLESNCRHGGALRIDHVMQLHHLFWIPETGKAAEGVYVQDNESDLLGLLALKSRQERTLIVGEDLGTVPFDFRERLMARGILSYRLFYFERDREENLIPANAYPRDALVSITTHDLPTLAGFWSGGDIDVRKSINAIDATVEETLREERTRHKAKIMERLVRDGHLPAEKAHAAWLSPVPTDDLQTAVLHFLLNTPARLALVNQEDIFLDVRRQNLPGTTHEHPNWVTKMRYTVEELTTSDEVKRFSEKLKELVEASGRRDPSAPR